MTTVKFAEASPYELERRKEHHTDFKYKQYLENSGAANQDTKLTAPDLKRLNVALFGLGRAGSIHLANIVRSTRFRLKYIVEADSKKAKRIQQEYDLDDSAILSTEAADVVFTDPKIDGVIIATPTFTHEQIVTQALTAGKAVLCEKPISQDEEGTTRCYAAAKQAGRPLLCAFNRRFEPAFVEVYDQVKKGIVGQVHIIKTVSRDSPLPSIDYLKISGGIYHDCAVHDIDLICWVLGEYPVKVSSVATCFIPEIKELRDYDTVAITMQFPSGTIGTIDLSRNAVYGYDQRLEVFGAKGMIEALNERPMQVSMSTVSSQSLPPIYHSFPSRYQEGYRQELNHFYGVVQGKEELRVTGENTLKISKIASALEESVKVGHLVDVIY